MFTFINTVTLYWVETRICILSLTFNECLCLFCFVRFWIFNWQLAEQFWKDGERKSTSIFWYRSGRCANGPCHFPAVLGRLPGNMWKFPLTLHGRKRSRQDNIKTLVLQGNCFSPSCQGFYDPRRRFLCRKWNRRRIHIWWHFRRYIIFIYLNIRLRRLKSNDYFFSKFDDLYQNI